MKKKYKILLVIVLTIMLIGCSVRNIENEDGSILTVTQKVEKTMEEMTLDEKIAQMLIVYYNSGEVDENLQNIIQTVQPGGFILMQPNITTVDKTRQFVETLQKNSKIPMMITIDQEGGSVQRLQNLSDKKPLSIPFMYDLGKTNDEILAYQVGKVMAEQLKTIGVNITFAPVLDIYSNPNNTVIGKRSFGSNPTVVSNMAISLAKGLEDNGIIATYKHFPGHGDTAMDSHFSLPIIYKNYEQIKSFELIPFVRSIENGAKMIMVGHLSLPNITGNNIPASLSKEIITDILYKDLNYQGLVVTDALNMKALTNDYSIEQIYTMAIEAGVDLLLMPNGSQNAIQYIKNNISEERINQSVKKILTFKYTYLKEYELLDSSYLNNSFQQEIINKIPTS